MYYTVYWFENRWNVFNLVRICSVVLRQYKTRLVPPPHCWICMDHPGPFPNLVYYVNIFLLYQNICWNGHCTPDMEIVVDSGILNSSNKMGLAETFGGYLHYFVVNTNICWKSRYYLKIFICIVEIFLAETKWIE